MTAFHRLKLTDETRLLIQRLHPDLKRKVRSALQQIIEKPHAGKALRDELEGLRSFPVGKIRIIYRLSSRTLEIIAIGPRKDIYTETFRLLQREKGP